jgi:drug/metabolite transporter (DMT)-like permease
MTEMTTSGAGSVSMLVRRVASDRIRVILAMGVVYVVWGTTYAGMRVVAESLPVFLAQGARFMVAGAVLLGVHLARAGAGAFRISAAELASTALVGTLLLVTSGGVTIYAEKTASSALAAVLLAVAPLWTLILRRVDGDRPPRVAVGGVFVGLVATLFVAWPRSLSLHSLGGSSLLLLLAGFSAALAAYLGSKLSLPRSSMLTAGVQLVVAGTILIVSGAASGEFGRLTLNVPARCWFAWGYLTLVGSVLCLSVFAWLLKHVSISVVSTYSYVNPVVAIVVAFVILHEHVSSRTLIGCVGIVVSVFVVVSSEQMNRGLRSMGAPSAVGLATPGVTAE